MLVQIQMVSSWGLALKLFAHYGVVELNRFITQLAGNALWAPVFLGPAVPVLARGAVTPPGSLRCRGSSEGI